MEKKQIEMIQTDNPDVVIKRTYIDEEVNVKAKNDEIVGRTLNLSQNIEKVRKLEAMEFEDEDLRRIVDTEIAFRKDCIRIDDEFLRSQQ